MTYFQYDENFTPTDMSVLSVTLASCATDRRDS